VIFFEELKDRMEDYSKFVDERVKNIKGNKLKVLVEALSGDSNKKKLEELNAKLDDSIQ